jgi:hypothetical protein
MCVDETVIDVNAPTTAPAAAALTLVVVDNHLLSKLMLRPAEINTRNCLFSCTIV